MVSQEEKTQATLVWALSIFFGFIPGLIFYLIAKDKPFVVKHAAESLGLSILMVAVWVGSMAMAFAGMAFLFFLFPLVGLFALVMCIMGAIAANKGEEFTVPVANAVTKAIFKV